MWFGGRVVSRATSGGVVKKKFKGLLSWLYKKDKIITTKHLAYARVSISFWQSLPEWLLLPGSLSKCQRSSLMDLGCQPSSLPGGSPPRCLAVPRHIKLAVEVVRSNNTQDI